MGRDEELLAPIQAVYVKKEELLALLKGQPDSEKIIAEMISKGILLELQENFYGIADRINQCSYPYEQIANHIYEPSYVSLEYALAYYRMIPEVVFVVTSMTTKPSTLINTPIGYFSYKILEKDRYELGLEHKQNEFGEYLIASPEKALADLVHIKSQGLTSGELMVDLLEFRRIPDFRLAELSKSKLQEIADKYDSQAVTNLSTAINSFI